jgi:hypothetical protein
MTTGRTEHLSYEAAYTDDSTFYIYENGNLGGREILILELLR